MAEGIKEDIGKDDRFTYLNGMCIITIGKNPKEGPYYPNSIQEYLVLKQTADRSRNRSGLGKKKKTAESGISFLQYAITQDLFMQKYLEIIQNYIRISMNTQTLSY
jgi:hypothetical protein